MSLTVDIDWHYNQPSHLPSFPPSHQKLFKCLRDDLYQWRYYGPVCARRSVNGLFRQNGSVFGPVLPQKSTFSGTNVLVWYIIRIIRARVIYLSTENNFNKLESMFDFNFSHEKHILSLAMVTDWQTKHKHKYVSQQIAMSDLQIDFI